MELEIRALELRLEMRRLEAIEIVAEEAEIIPEKIIEDAPEDDAPPINDHWPPPVAPPPAAARPKRPKYAEDHHMNRAKEYVKFVRDNDKHPRKNSKSKTPEEKDEKALGSWLYNYARGHCDKSGSAVRPDVDVFLDAELGQFWTDLLAKAALDRNDAAFVESCCGQARELIAYFGEHGALPALEGAHGALTAAWYRWVRECVDDKPYKGKYTDAIKMLRECGIKDTFDAAIAQRLAKQEERAVL